MKKRILIASTFMMFFCGLAQLSKSQTTESQPLKINTSGYYEKKGLNVLVFSSHYRDNESDGKNGGIEIIHHGVRTATNGDIRLNPTPEQWDPHSKFIARKVNEKGNVIEVSGRYEAYDFNYTIKSEARDGGVLLSVDIEKPLPKELEGLAGFNLEFLPSAYFEKSYLMDNKPATFPLYPSGSMQTIANKLEPAPLSQGHRLVLAPENPYKRVSIQSNAGDLMLFDGRNKAQNGWYVVRSLIPVNKTGRVIEWLLTASTVKDWVREPMIAFSQLGYHPSQRKTVVIELDVNDTLLSEASLFKLDGNGEYLKVHHGPTSKWGRYLRYDYGTYDFTEVRESGLYVVEYGKVRTKPFKISGDIYRDAWTQTSDIFFPVQMDHMFVNEAYRVWHGASHLDDALQAPVNHEHVDFYMQGPSTDTQYKPGQHIPGLNVGGWFDAGDYDLRTQTQYLVVSSLAQTWEMFRTPRDETYIDQQTRYVDIHRPDGKPDLLQQIEHGTLFLLSHFRATGRALNGIVEARTDQYTHLGDAITKTDNLIYDAKLDSLQTDGMRSGTFDDRWVFTSKSTALNYGSIASLAAASRSLAGFNDTLAQEAIKTAEAIWEEEHSHEPDIFVYGNTTGGRLDEEEIRAAVELLITTKNKKYAKRINEMWPAIEKRFGNIGAFAVRAMPYMDKQYAQKIEARVRKFKVQLEGKKENPFGVTITRGSWAGSGVIVDQAITNFYLHKAFPELIDKEYVYRALNFLYGCHPGSNISFVSAVGTESKTIAYGTNRADFSFIAGGVVPGVVLIKPDFPENKNDWPFLWGENEYVVDVAAAYIFLVNAANSLLVGSK